MGGMIFGWRRGAAALVLGGATVLAALAMPVSLPEQGARTDPAGTLPEVAAEAAPEDLGAFLESRRWGISFEDIRKESAPPVEPDGPSINPALAKMGFVGLIVTKEESAVLLKSPDGGIARVAPGDTLPDGRTLVSVTDNSLTLKGGDLPEEVLTLFPPIRTPPPDGSGPAGGAGSREGAALSGAAEASASR